MQKSNLVNKPIRQIAVFENVITYSNEQTWAVTIIQQVGKKKRIGFKF